MGSPWASPNYGVATSDATTTLENTEKVTAFPLRHAGSAVGLFMYSLK